MRAIASAISTSVTISGGRSRTTLSPAATVRSFSARKASTRSPFGTTVRRPISSPSPRTSAITAGCRSFSSASRCLSRSGDPPHAIEEAGREHHIEHRIAGRHRQRIAAEGRAVGAGRHALRRFGGGEAGAERKSAAERLGERHDVRLDAGRLIGEQLAGAADAGLHLVEDQQQPCSSQSWRRPLRNRDGTARTPPSPWIGSIRIAAVSGPMARLTAARSTNVT